MLHSKRRTFWCAAVLIFFNLFPIQPRLLRGQELCEAPPLPQEVTATHRRGKPLLRVAADPNNLPFSNERLEGFENKLAAMIAQELGAEIEYVWRAQRRGFFRHTLKDGGCDLVMGVPEQFGQALTTRPYYRSSYVFVTRTDRKFTPNTFDDPALPKLRIGIQMINDDGRNTPPAHALADRGMIENIVGYTVYGDYSLPNPPARIVAAVAEQDVDTAVVWGPVAGYFAAQSKTPLSVSVITPAIDRTGLPFTFAISIGVSRARPELRDRLNEVLRTQDRKVQGLLKEFNVPLIAAEDAAPQASK